MTSLLAAIAGPSVTRARAIDASGTFRIHGKPPQAFANLGLLEIAGDDKYGWKAHPPDYGSIDLNNKAETVYKLLKPTVDDKKISFKTQSTRGVSYEFDGSFLLLDFAEKGMSNEVVLTGTLRKMVGGKVTAEAKLDFDYTPGD